MSVDAKLYLNTRWELDDIKRVLERTQGKEVTVKSNHDISLGYFNFFVGDRMIHIFANSHTPIGEATYLSMASNTEGRKILKDIAQVLGGVFMENDYDGKCELIEGAMCEGDGLPYFIKFAIVHDGIDADDLHAFIASKQAWHKRIDKQ